MDKVFEYNDADEMLDEWASGPAGGDSGVERSRQVKRRVSFVTAAVGCMTSIMILGGWRPAPRSAEARIRPVAVETNWNEVEAARTTVSPVSRMECGERATLEEEAHRELTALALEAAKWETAVEGAAAAMLRERVVADEALAGFASARLQRIEETETRANRVFESRRAGQDAVARAEELGRSNQLRAAELAGLQARARESRAALREATTAWAGRLGATQGQVDEKADRGLAEATGEDTRGDSMGAGGTDPTNVAEEASAVIRLHARDLLALGWSR